MIVLSEVVDSLPSPTRNPGIDLALQMAAALEVPRHSLGYPQSSQEASQEASQETQYENLLADIPDYDLETLGLWIGETPTATHYEAVYHQALQKGIRLLNTPQEHEMLYDLEQMSTRLQDFVPASAVITDVSQCAAAVQSSSSFGAIAPLKFPLSVRGMTPFNPLSPRANTLEELQHLVGSLLQQSAELSDQENDPKSLTPNHPKRSVLLQQVVPLRAHSTPIGMAQGRIFRVFLYRQMLITYGYAWTGDHPERYLSSPEEEALLSVVSEAIAHVNAPFVSLDVGQLETQEWVVLGMGDPQFTPTEQIPWIQFWQAMREIK
jgi:hypothetical protein